MAKKKPSEILSIILSAMIRQRQAELMWIEEIKEQADAGVMPNKLTFEAIDKQLSLNLEVIRKNAGG